MITRVEGYKCCLLPVAFFLQAWFSGFGFCPGDMFVIFVGIISIL